eukprot:1159889-Pelagomonas_calceolata.AAC.3
MHAILTGPHALAPKGGWPCSLPSSSRLRQPPLACVRYMRGMLRRKGWGSPMLRGGTRQAAVGAGLPAAYLHFAKERKAGLRKVGRRVVGSRVGGVGSVWRIPRGCTRQAAVGAGLHAAFMLLVQSKDR